MLLIPDAMLPTQLTPYQQLQTEAGGAYYESMFRPVTNLRNLLGLGEEHAGVHDVATATGASLAPKRRHLAAVLDEGDHIGVTFVLAGGIMMVATLFFVYQAFTINGKWKNSMFIVACVTATAFWHYITLSDLWVDNKKVLPMCRYVDWFLTVPLQVIEFWMILRASCGASAALFWQLFAAAMLMLIFGYLGETEVINVWATFFCGMAAWAFIIYVITLGEAGRCSEQCSPSVKKAYNCLRIIVTFGWALYPIGYVVGNGSGNDSTAEDMLNAIYNLADLVNKVAFGMAIFVGAMCDEAVRADQVKQKEAEEERKEEEEERAAEVMARILGGHLAQMEHGMANMMGTELKAAMAPISAGLHRKFALEDVQKPVGGFHGFPGGLQGGGGAFHGGFQQQQVQKFHQAQAQAQPQSPQQANLDQLQKILGGGGASGAQDGLNPQLIAMLRNHQMTNDTVATAGNNGKSGLDTSGDQTPGLAPTSPSNASPAPATATNIADISLLLQAAQAQQNANSVVNQAPQSPPQNHGHALAAAEMEIERMRAALGGGGGQHQQAPLSARNSISPGAVQVMNDGSLSARMPQAGTQGWN